MYNIAERGVMSNQKSKTEARGGTPFRLEVAGDFLLLLTLTWFFCGGLTLAALALAAAVHELGHAAVMVFQGQLPRSLRLDAAGLCLRCEPAEGEGRELLRTLAGPAAGLLLAMLLGESGIPFFRLAASASLALSGLNLLPASCLDGGRLIRSLAVLTLGSMPADRLGAVLDWACILLFLCMGFGGRGDWLLWGVWLLYHRLRS